MPRDGGTAALPGPPPSADGSPTAAAVSAAADAYPTYIQQYNAITGWRVSTRSSPVSGLTALQALQFMAQGCQPLNPFGNQPLSGSVPPITPPIPWPWTLRSNHDRIQPQRHG